MSLKATIGDATGGNFEAKVTSRHQLVTAPLEFSTFYQATANLDNAAFNIVGPEVHKQFVITDVIASGDKNVGTGGVDVNIYESDADDGTSTKDILTVSLAKLGSANLIGLNLILTTGVWLNATMDDNNVNLTILGYYVKALT